MKISIERGQFLKALSHGQSVVEKKSTIPILSHVLLQAEDGQLSLTTTDMDMALVERLPAIVERPGSAAISAQTLFEIVRKLPEGVMIELKLNPENDQVTLKAGKSRFNLSSLPATHFPKLTQDDLPHTFKITVEALRRLIDRAKFAMCVDDTRYYLNGIYFHPHEREGKQVFRSVATDAHRLACIDIPLPEGAVGVPGVIVGRKTLMEVRKLLEEQDMSIEVRLSSRRIEFRLPNATLSSRLIDGEYPNYEEGIPFENDKTLIVDSKSFAAAIDRVATVAMDKDKAKVVKLLASDNQLTLSAASHELGDASEEIVVDYPFQDSVEIAFNARYLLDIAQQIGDNEAEVLLSSGEVPALIRSMNDPDSLFVIMPIRF